MTSRGALAAGVRAILPLAAGIVPFGIVYGVAVVDSSVPAWVGGIASPIILAGAAQLALLDLIDEGAPWIVAVVTALVINARFVMYSGALAPAFSDFPRPWRYLLAYFVTDQASVTALLYYEGDRDPPRRLRYFLGAGALMAGCWVMGTWLGIVFGVSIPEGWQLGFAVPLMFLALLVPSIRDRPTLVAAVVGGAGAMTFRSAPFNLGIILGAASGITAGLVVRR